MQKRVTFRHRWLPYLLVAPQIVVTLVFFIWPAYRAFETSFFIEDAFGFSREWVGLLNYEILFSDPAYLRSWWIPARSATGQAKRISTSLPSSDRNASTGDL